MEESKRRMSVWLLQSDMADFANSLSIEVCEDWWVLTCWSTNRDLISVQYNEQDWRSASATARLPSLPHQPKRGFASGFSNSYL
jgi:hypothetical protein